MSNQTISFIPAVGKEKLQYQVTVKSYSKYSNREESVLRYSCFILLKKQSWNGYIVNFTRTNFSSDHMNKNEPIFEVLLKTGEILNEIDLEIASHGEIIHIYNWKKFKIKWEEIKFKIKSTYKGTIVDQIISQMDISLATEQSTILSLNKDPFFYNYLMGIYGYYKNNKILFKGTLRGFIPKHVLPFTRINKISKDNSNDAYTIQSSATVDDNDIKELREKLKLEDEDTLVFNINSRYLLSKNKIIDSVFVDNTLKNNDKILYSSKIKIKQII